jgi:hypothetical protein
MRLKNSLLAAQPLKLFFSISFASAMHGRELPISLFFSKTLLPLKNIPLF